MAEFIRRFFYFSNSVYLAADFILITCAALAFRGSRPRLDRELTILLAAYVLWGMASLLYSQSNALLGLVGLRPLVLSVAVYFIAEKYFRSIEGAEHTFYKTIGLSLVLILGVAVVQIASGAEAAVNALPNDLNAEFGGRGDYVAAGGGLAWLFRPTSIFMHTGRLGQYSFFLALTLLLPILLKREVDGRYWALALLAILLVLVSGQRAAGVFLVSAGIMTVFLFGSKKLLARTIFAAIIVTLFFIVISPELREIVLTRFASGFIGGIDRVIEMTKHWGVGFSKYPVFGQGLGFFSFGGKAFGGQIYYEFMPRFGGGGENAWLRIQGETGVPGLLIFVGLIATVAIKSYRRARLATNSDRSIHLSSCFFAFFSMFWALTHDVYGNYLFLIPMFLLFAASAGLARKRIDLQKLAAKHPYHGTSSLMRSRGTRMGSTFSR